MQPPFLFDGVKTTYLITMEHSFERQKNVLKAIIEMPLTQNLVVIYNRGKEFKDGVVSNTCDDILFVYKYIASLEEKNKCQTPFLVLEDDAEFTFQLKRKGKEWASRVEERMLDPKVDLISLGCVPVLSFKESKNFIRVIRGGDTQGVLYKGEAVGHLRKMSFTGTAHDWELYKKCKCIATLSPLVVQRHEQTPNSLNYDPSGLLMFLIYFLGGDKHPCTLYSVLHFIGAFGGLFPVLLFLILSLSYVLRASHGSVL